MFSLRHSFSDSDSYLSEIPLFEAKTCHLFKLQQVFCRLILKANNRESALCLQLKLTVFGFQRIDEKTNKQKKCSGSPPPCEHPCCWAPTPKPSESSGWQPQRCPMTGGTCPHADDPVGRKCQTSC